MRIGASTQLLKIVLELTPLGLDLVSIPGYSNDRESRQSKVRKTQKIAGRTINPRPKF